MARIEVRLSRSVIGRPGDQKRTAFSLGLRKTGRVKVYKDTPSLRGSLRKIEHLVTVTELDRASPAATPASESRSSHTEQTALTARPIGTPSLDDFVAPDDGLVPVTPQTGPYTLEDPSGALRVKGSISGRGGAIVRAEARIGPDGVQLCIGGRDGSGSLRIARAVVATATELGPHTTFVDGELLDGDLPPSLRRLRVDGDWYLVGVESLRSTRGAAGAAELLFISPDDASAHDRAEAFMSIVGVSGRIFDESWATARTHASELAGR